MSLEAAVLELSKQVTRLTAENGMLHSQLRRCREDSAKRFDLCERIRSERDDARATITEQADTLATLRLRAERGGDETSHALDAAISGNKALAFESERLRADIARMQSDLDVARSQNERDFQQLTQIDRMNKRLQAENETLRLKILGHSCQPRLGKPVAYCISMPDPEDTKVHSLSFDKASLERVVTAHGGKIEPLYRMKS